MSKLPVGVHGCREDGASSQNFPQPSECMAQGHHPTNGLPTALWAHSPDINSFGGFGWDLSRDAEDKGSSQSHGGGTRPCTVTGLWITSDASAFALVCPVSVWSVPARTVTELVLVPWTGTGWGHALSRWRQPFFLRTDWSDFPDPGQSRKASLKAEGPRHLLLSLLQKMIF